MRRTRKRQPAWSAGTTATNTLSSGWCQSRPNSNQTIRKSTISTTSFPIEKSTRSKNSAKIRRVSHTNTLHLANNQILLSWERSSQCQQPSTVREVKCRWIAYPARRTSTNRSIQFSRSFRRGYPCWRDCLPTTLEVTLRTYRWSFLLPSTPKNDVNVVVDRLLIMAQADTITSTRITWRFGTWTKNRFLWLWQGNKIFLRDTFTFVFMQRAVLDQEDLGKGDRIATFMFYVSHSIVKIDYLIWKGLWEVVRLLNIHLITAPSCSTYLINFRDAMAPFKTQNNEFVTIFHGHYYKGPL